MSPEERQIESDVIELREAGPENPEPAISAPEKGDQESLPCLGEDYEVLGQIGRGGMGSVYKVRDRKLDRILAFKLLDRTLAEDQVALKRFEQEAAAASQLDHDNLVAVYGHGRTHDGTPYLVMDYLEGKNLSEVLKEEGTMEPGRALSIFQQIAEALRHAHEKNVIHRDIKPTNIILTRTESGVEIARIVDFGIAKVMPAANRETHDLTETGEVFGSPHYMSPEQCLGFMLDQRSDIYSLGCLMYEALTGDSPFAGANPIQVVVKHINEDPVKFPASITTGSIAKKLERAVLHCLEKDKNNRYQSASDLIKDLDLIKAGKNPPAYSSGKKHKAQFSQRQVLSFWFASLLVLFYTPAIIAGTSFGNILSTLMPAAAAAIGLLGTWVFYSMAWDKHKQMHGGRASASAWWSLLIPAFIGTAILSLVPFAVSIMGLGISLPKELVEALFPIPLFLHIFSVLGALASSLGYLIFRKEKKVAFPYIVTRLFCTVMVLVGLACVLLPKPIALGLQGTAWYVEKHNPGLCLRIMDLASFFDSDLQACISLAQRAAGDGRYRDAIGYLDRFLSLNNKDIYQRSIAFYHRADCHNKLGIKDQATKDALAAVKENPNKEQTLKAVDLLKGMGEYQYALQAIDIKLARFPREMDVQKKRLELLIEMKRFQEAINTIDSLIAAGGQTDLQSMHFVKAELERKLGLDALARTDYWTVIRILEPLPPTPYGNALMSWSYKQIGDGIHADQYRKESGLSAPSATIEQELASRELTIKLKGD